MTHLELAVVLAGTGTGCRVRFLGITHSADAAYAQPMVEHRLVAQAGQLVAIDRSAGSPRVVYRWQDIAVTQDGENDVLTRDGETIDPDRLRADAFPRIRAMVRRIEMVKAVDPKTTVQQGYDRIAEQYLAWTLHTREQERERYAAVLLDALPDGARVLDLGCGAGLPTTRALARRFRVTGVDISARQIALAREHVPGAEFIQADMTQLDLPSDSFDAVTAFYAIIHVPREEQPALLADIASWLHPGGLLVMAMSSQATDAGVEEDWLGAPMFWSGYDGKTNRRLIEEAGLHVVRAQDETVEEFGDPVTFLWVVAQKPA